MILYDQATKMIISAAGKHVLKTEQIRLDRCMGRTVSENIFSKENVPSFNNSAMDGFALLAEQTINARSDRPVRLPVTALVAAGDRPHTSNSAGAVEIMTGAVLPEGLYDAVVRLEDVERIGDAIEIRRPVRAGENVRVIGSDIKEGLQLIEKGTVIRAEHVLALASVGQSVLPVYAQPKVAIIPTGKELISWDSDDLAPGQIRNSTAPFLVSVLEAQGASVKVYPVVADQPDVFREQLLSIVNEQYDMVISTGAVSVGKFDFVLSVLEQIGASVHFHKCAIRPGKPILFADLPGGSAFFGLPGNTVSTTVGFRFFVAPFLRQVLGQKQERPRKLKLMNPVQKPHGLRCFFKAQIDQGLDGDRVKVLAGQASFMVVPLLSADAWAVLPEDATQLDSDVAIDVFTLKPE